MWPMMLMACLLIWPAAQACAADEIVGTVKEERIAQKDAGREHLQMVKRSMILGNVAFRYQQVVDPQQGDKPVAQRYGDYILGCEFPRYTWNWDLQYFLEATVERPGEKPFNANRAVLQEAMVILQQGSRGVADMVWQLPASPAQPAPGRVVFRFLKTPDEPEWMTVLVAVEGEPQTQLKQVQVSSYPTVTSGPPERQRWASTLTRAMQMDKFQPLNMAEEWGLVMHNRYAHEEGGSLLVVDPEPIVGGEIGGTYPIAVRLAPKPGSSAVSFMMGYFWDTPYQRAVDTFRAQAPERLKRLRATDWQVPVDLARWQAEQAETQEVLALAGPEAGETAAEWQRVQGEMQATLAALQQGGKDPALSRRAVLLMRAAAEIKARLYEPALAKLIQQATQ